MATKVKETASEAEAVKDTAYYEQRVEITLFKDGDKYKDDVFVSVNGDNCRIKRGEPVAIKRKFAEALTLSHAEEIRINENKARLEEEFKKTEEKFGQE